MVGYSVPDPKDRSQGDGCDATLLLAPFLDFFGIFWAFDVRSGARQDAQKDRPPLLEILVHP